MTHVNIHHFLKQHSHVTKQILIMLFSRMKKHDITLLIQSQILGLEHYKCMNSPYHFNLAVTSMNILLDALSKLEHKTNLQGHSQTFQNEGAAMGAEGPDQDSKWQLSIDTSTRCHFISSGGLKEGLDF